MTQLIKKVGTARLLYDRAEEMNLSPLWLVTNGTFLIQTEVGERFINRGVSSLNSPVSTSLARNKFHTHLLLDRHGIPNIPYMRTKQIEEAEKFLEQHGTIILKPNRGEGSKDIHIVRTKEQLRSLKLSGNILEKYTPGIEMRYLVLAGNVIAVHESRYGDSVDRHRELERISYDENTWDQELVTISTQICDIFGLGFAAIDFLIDSSGPKVLEINSSPGFKWFHAPTTGPMVDVAKLFLEETVKSIR